MVRWVSALIYSRFNDLYVGWSPWMIDEKLWGRTRLPKDLNGWPIDLSGHARLNTETNVNTTKEEWRWHESSELLTKCKYLLPTPKMSLTCIHIVLVGLSGIKAFYLHLSSIKSHAFNWLLFTPLLYTLSYQFYFLLIMKRSKYLVSIACLFTVI